MAKIAVVGAGMMGSALCVPLADRGHDVRLIGTPLDTAGIGELLATRRHSRLGIELPAGISFHYVAQLGAATADVDAVVLGVSSAGVGWAAQALSPILSQRYSPVLMLSKGLELGPEGPSVLTEAFCRGLSMEVARACKPVAVCGPCIAGELCRRVPTLVVLTGHDLDVARRFAAWIATPYYHVRVHADVIGVQVCAALKNAYAMGVALGVGLHERAHGQGGSVAMHNYEAAVFAQAMLEMQKLVAWLGGDAGSVAGLAGAGDLTVTCNGGRTGRFGALLGRGHGAREAVALMQGVTLECLEVLSVLDRYLASAHSGELRRRELPLLSHLIELGLHAAPLAMPFEEFSLA